MSNKKMFFGTPERMTWVNCPAIDVDLSKGRWSVGGEYLNGGAYVRRSQTGHKIYRMAWNLADQEDIYDIVNYDDGLYGDGLIYFYEAFAIASNVLPQYWASPRLARNDAPPLVLGKRPSLVATGSNTRGYPTMSAVYNLSNSDKFATLWLPIPEGYVLHIGAHGSATDTASVAVIEDGDTDSTPLTLLSVTTPVLTNHTFSGVPGVTLTLSGSGNLTLAGLVAQVLPEGKSAPTGNFISGRGHSGCRFSGPAQVTGLSAVLNKVSASVVLVETGAWENEQ